MLFIHFISSFSLTSIVYVFNSVFRILHQFDTICFVLKCYNSLIVSLSIWLHQETFSFSMNQTPMLPRMSKLMHWTRISKFLLLSWKHHIWMKVYKIIWILNKIQDLHFRWFQNPLWENVQKYRIFWILSWSGKIKTFESWDI